MEAPFREGEEGLGFKGFGILGLGDLVGSFQASKKGSIRPYKASFLVL